MWWEILKNAKVSGKATGKGSSFDASKIKINIDDKDDCCEEFWKTIQEFKNEHIIVFKVMVSVRRTTPTFGRQMFDGIGHRYYEGDTLVMPVSSNKPCLDSRMLFSLLEDIYFDIIESGYKEVDKEWKEIGGHVKGSMFPFLPKHYWKANLRQVNEWPKLVGKFTEEYNDLWLKYQDCEKLKDDTMKWRNMIKGSCCDACDNLNKESGAVAGIGGSHDGESQPKKNKALYNIKYGGGKNDEEIDN